MRLSALRKPLYEATMISQEMSDFIESTLDELETILDEIGPYTWAKGKEKFIYGGEVRSDVKVKPSLPQFTTKIINVYLEVSYDKDNKNSNGGIKGGEFRSDIFILVPIGYFGRFSQYKNDLRETIAHEVVHAFDPKYWYHRPGASVTSVSELDENLESFAYIIAGAARGNRDKLISVLKQRRGDLRNFSPPIVDDPKLWQKFVRRTIEIWEKYFKTPRLKIA